MKVILRCPSCSAHPRKEVERDVWIRAVLPLSQDMIRCDCGAAMLYHKDVKE
jgi:hypothetical protein